LKESEKENREVRTERDFGPDTEKLKNLSSSPEKSRSLLRQGARSEKSELIAAEKADSTTRYPVIKMCAWLGVSTSGFYDHHNAVEADPAQRCAKIIIHVQAAYRAVRGAHGVRDDHDIEFRRRPFLTARVTTAVVWSWEPVHRTALGLRPGPAAAGIAGTPALVSLPTAAVAAGAALLAVDALTPLGSHPGAALDHRPKPCGWSAAAVGTRRARPCPPQPAYGFAVHAEPVRQELSNERR
jgi:hypothetical protein